MSIQSEINRISENVNTTLNTIAETGVTVGSGSDALPAAAAALANEKLSTGGGTVSGSLTLSNSSAQSGQPGIKWKTLNSKTPYTGYCTGSSDSTFVVGSLAGTTYQTGLAIGGSSGNLLWKGTKVATTSDIPTVPTKTSQLTNDSGFKTTDNNTTYSLSKSGSTITLTGSDGSTTSVTDSSGSTITVDSAMSSSSINPVQNKVVNSALSAKAALASPTFTGTPKAPTAAAGTNTTQIATTAFVTNAINNVSGSAATVTYTVTIPRYTESSNWTLNADSDGGSWNTIDIPVSGILATDNPVVDVVLNSDDYPNISAVLEDWAKVYRITTSANSIRVCATSMPENNITIQLKVVR